MFCNCVPYWVIDYMKIEVFQIFPVLSNVLKNIDAILAKYESSQADVCIFPELSTTGYAPQDLLLNQTFIDVISKTNQQIVSQTNSKAIIFGSVVQENGKLFNAGIVAQSGKIIGISTKKHLPNTGVFCESRYFTSGVPQSVNINGVNFGVLICEDTWHDSSYTQMQNADVLCSINASPFEVFPDGKTKLQKRIEVFQKNASLIDKPFIYCNSVGFYNGILFDGNSFIFENKFTLMKSFMEDSYVFSMPCEAHYQYEIHQNAVKLKKEAIVFGIGEFFASQGKAIIGLSGGADSALVATLAVKALGKKGVLCVMMPSRYTSQESIDDAKLLAHNLGVELRNIPIQKMVDEYQNCLKLSGTALENIQARIRGNILMAISNQENGLVLTTGNKSEVAVGY